MNIEKQPNTGLIDLSQLIKETGVDIIGLKKLINNTDQIKAVSEKLQLLEQEKVRATNEQLGKIRQLQDEFNIINSTKESITALRSHIETKSVKSNTPSPTLPTIKLDDRFTESEVAVNRITPINKVKEQESGAIAGAFSSLLNKIGITDNTNSVA